MRTTTNAICRRQQIATQFTGGIAIAFLAIAVLFIAPTVLRAAQPLPGAVFTTDSTCTGVDLNIYASKDAVYINGGPAHPGAAGLTDGSYCVQVTDPGTATVLGTSAPGAVIVSGGEFVQNPDTLQGPCYQLSAILTKASDGTPGYDNTTNQGGEYKLSISTDCTFTNSYTKTDNFKVVGSTPPPPPENGRLCVDKFYDANADGIFNGTDQLIEQTATTPGWLVFISGGLLQNDYVTQICLRLPQGSYTVYEAQSTIGNWIQTASILDGVAQNPIAFPVSVTVNPGDDHAVLFGNTCLGAGGGLTLGFWSNKNGQKLETADDFNFLSALCLVNGAGIHQTWPADTTAHLASAKTNFSNWLLAASATNMANMLSAQLATMELNVRHGFVDGAALVYAGSCGNAGVNNEYISIYDLMAAASADLCTLGHNKTLSGSPYRAYQECLKNALDKANNNLNFVEPTPAACGGFSFNN
jgi:hypothetical protein